MNARVSAALRGLVCGVFAGLMALGASHAVGAEPGRKLNVLFIAIDDQNARLGCYGAPVKTPNIDRLARMGRRFDRAYCQYPLCNPSRTSVMSGWRPEKTGVLGNGTAPRPHLTGATWLQEHFHDQGYFTARVGKIYHGAFENQFKWDVPAAQPAASPARPGGRQRPRAIRGSAQAESAPAGERNRREGTVPISWRATDRADEDEPDGRTARRVAEIIEESKDRPFFIAAGFLKPHLPFVCPRPYFEMYPPASIRFEPDPADDRSDIPPMALVSGPRDPQTDDVRREAMAAYSACTSFVDAQIGVLLATLDRLKLWESTVVLLYGDNGFHLGEHGQWRKMSLFEESTRVPLIIVAPGMPQPGTATRELAEFVDMYPTLVELCGLPRVEGIEGASLVPLLKDPAHAVKTAAFTVVTRGEGQLGRSVRTDRYRYTEWPDGEKELYDHEKDPHEYVNLARNQARRSDLEEMSRILHAGYKAALRAE